jgi:hypothetical protein
MCLLNKATPKCERPNTEHWALHISPTHLDCVLLWETCSVQWSTQRQGPRMGVLPPFLPPLPASLPFFLPQSWWWNLNHEKQVTPTCWATPTPQPSHYILISKAFPFHIFKTNGSCGKCEKQREAERELKLSTFRTHIESQLTCSMYFYACVSTRQITFYKLELY